MIKMNKKAQLGTAVVWVYHFILLVIVLGGIAAIVLAHYSIKYDVRDVETVLVARKVISCLSDNEDRIVLENMNEETIRSCLSLSYDEKEFYIKAEAKEEKKSVSFGDSSVKIYCEAEEKGIKGKYLPKCLIKSYYVMTNKGTTYLDLVVGIKKLEKNV